MHKFLVPKPTSDEDASPIAVEARGRVYVGVCDGLGGSGSRTYTLRTGTPPQIRTEAGLRSGGTVGAGVEPPAPLPDIEGPMSTAVLDESPPSSWSGAYLASRSVSRCVEDVIGSENSGDLTRTGLREALVEAITDGLVSLDSGYVSGSRVSSGGLVRAFPTTLALARMSGSGEGHCDIDVFWAGDSRVYLVDQAGLHVLTRDHLQLTPLQSGWSSPDSPMTNVIHLGQVEIDTATVRTSGSFAVFASSDGCFGYWPSAMHFELAVLRSACQAEDSGDWTARLEREVARVAQDDASLSLAFVGGNTTFEDFRDQLRPRLRYLSLLLGAVGESDASLMDQVWHMYRWDYERHLPPIAAQSPDRGQIRAGGDLDEAGVSVEPLLGTAEEVTLGNSESEHNESQKEQGSAMPGAGEADVEPIVTIYRTIGVHLPPPREAGAAPGLRADRMVE